MEFPKARGVKTWKPSVVRYGYFLELPISCQVVAYRKQKTKEYIKFLAQNVVAVSLEI